LKRTRKKRGPRPFTVELIESRCIKIPDAGCWIWDGRISGHGYGRLKYLNKDVGAHRASYIAHNGPIPDGMSILHKCDVRCCVNPYHLYAGTHQENMDDMKTRGRTYRSSGAKAVHAKLSDADAIDIFNSSLLYKEIAIKYGVSPTTVSNIKTKKRWRHIHH